jgi:tetratricopeptide (TPR) repeat protein
MYLGNQMLEKGAYEEAKGYYEKILRYEKELLMISDVYLYKVYAQLSEVNTYMKDIDQARHFHKKGKDLIGKLIASREVQSLYMNLVEEDYDQIIQSIPMMDVSEYDENSLARYNRVVGSAYYNMQAYKEAIEYLERAIGLYKDESYSAITCLIYDELSKCYSEMGDYKKAYDCLNKAQLKNKG